MKLHNNTNWLICLSILLCATIITFAQNNSDNTRKKSPVDFKADFIRPVKVGDSSAINLLGNVVFHHKDNGTIITCDSAIRYSNTRIECFNNVVINKQDTYLYGDRADYDGERNLANIYGPIIKMVNKDATMYTHKFAFNTLTSVGIFGGGATMSQKENLLESNRGFFYADSSILVCIDDVEIKNPDYKLQSDSVSYNLNSDIATFYTKTLIWNSKGEILSAKKGVYDQKNTTYNFTSDSYILTEKQELWSDTLNYNSKSENAVLYNNIQMLDSDKKVMLFGDFAEYWGSLNNALLTDDPSIINFDPEQPDTLYMRSDTIFIYTVNSDSLEIKDTGEVEEEYIEEVYVDDKIAESDSTAMDSTREVNIKSDSTTNGNKEIAIIAVDSTIIDLNNEKELSRADKRKLKKEQKKAKSQESIKRSDAIVVVDIEADVASDSIIINERTESVQKADSTLLGIENIKEPKLVENIDLDDLSWLERRKIRREQRKLEKEAKVKAKIELRNRAKAIKDSLNRVSIDSMSIKSLKDTVAVDSLSAELPIIEKDSIQHIIKAYNNVRIYRSDFQAVCDSLVGFSMDSTMHLYINPVLWNQANQITSNEIDIYTRNQVIDKAVFTGEPIMASKVGDEYFNQIKGKVIEAIMIDNTIKRTEVIGNGQTYYYMQDDKDGSIKGFLVVESADITFVMDSNTIETINYKTNPVYSLYPMDKIPLTQEIILPGFKWEENRRPMGKESVFNRIIRNTRREEYESMPLPTFNITKSIFDSKEKMIKDGIWRERNEIITESTLQGL